MRRKEKENERERKMREEKENDCPFLLDTLSEKEQKKIMLIFLLYILIHLAGSLVAFDTTTENYTVPVSGKCVLTCYVAEVRSFKVSYSYIFSFLLCHHSPSFCIYVCWPDVIVLFVGSTNFCVCMLITNICDVCYHSRIHPRWAN